MKNIIYFLALLISLSWQQPALAHSDHENPETSATQSTTDDHGHDHGDDDEHEAGIQLPVEQASYFGIQLEQPQSRPIGSRIPVIGTLITLEDARHQISMPFPAMVQKVMVKAGDAVKPNQPLADVLVRDSQQRITLRSPTSGVVTQRLVSAGEFVNGTALLEITNTDQLWFEFSVFPADFSRIAEGNSIYLDDGKAVVRWISPTVNAQGQLTARAQLENSHHFRLGQTLRGNWVWQAGDVSLAIKRTALQTLENDTVVFVVHGNSFEAQPVITGRQDVDWVEILSGIGADTTYASTRSYLLKADLLKAGAEHSH